MKKLILVGLAGLALSCRSGNQFAPLDPMPSVKMVLADSSLYSTDQIPEGRYTVIMYFRTDCGHCQRETSDILKNEDALQNINIILLTLKSYKDLRSYCNHFKLGNYANIKAATDTKLQFYNYYKPKAVPYLVVYNQHNRLYRIYEGPVPVDSLVALTKG